MLKKTSSEVCQIEGQHQPSALVAATIDTFLFNPHTCADGIRSDVLVML